jgi:hypothetical protein
MPLKTLFLVQYTVYIALFYVTLNARETTVDASDAYTNGSTIKKEHILSYLGDDSGRVLANSIYREHILSIENTFYLQRAQSIAPRGRQWTRATRPCSGPLTGV